MMLSQLTLECVINVSWLQHNLKRKSLFPPAKHTTPHLIFVKDPVKKGGASCS